MFPTTLRRASRAVLPSYRDYSSTDEEEEPSTPPALPMSSPTLRRRAPPPAATSLRLRTLCAIAVVVALQRAGQLDPSSLTLVQCGLHQATPARTKLYEEAARLLKGSIENGGVESLAFCDVDAVTGSTVLFEMDAICADAGNAAELGRPLCALVGQLTESLDGGPSGVFSLLAEAIAYSRDWALEQSSEHLHFERQQQVGGPPGFAAHNELTCVEKWMGKYGRQRARKQALRRENRVIKKEAVELAKNLAELQAKAEDATALATAAAAETRQKNRAEMMAEFQTAQALADLDGALKLDAALKENAELKLSKKTTAAMLLKERGTVTKLRKAEKQHAADLAELGRDALKADREQQESVKASTVLAGQVKRLKQQAEQYWRRAIAAEARRI